MTRSLILAALALAATSTAQAQMPGMQMGATPGDPPSTAGYKAAMATMEHGMSIPYTGDPDRDFVAGMLPHHQGAVDMAEVELKYGRDPQLRKLARDIVAAQRKEIAFMQAWRAQHAGK